MTDRAGCMCCAYGPLTTFPAIVGFFAMVLTYCGAFGCSLFESGTNGDNEATVGSFGLFSVQGIEINMSMNSDLMDHGCYSYTNVVPFGDPSYYLDAPMKAGRAFASMAAIFAIPLWVTIMMLCCVSFGSNTLIFPVIVSLCTLTGIFTILILVGMASQFCKDRELCSIGTSGILAIIAFFLWLSTAVLVSVLNKEPRGRQEDTPIIEHRSSTPKEATTVTRTHNDDGTTTAVTRKSITNPDGSQSVTETRVTELP